MSTPSLHGFLQMTGAKFRLFDLGLNLSKLPEQTLSELDNGKAYPRPHLGFAWLVVFMWNPDQANQNSLWFMKLPLDEQGILPAGVHSDLVNRLYRALDVSDIEERQKLLTEHPYQFTPDHEKMAALHAIASQTLQQPASEFYPTAKAFFEQSDASIKWQHLGIQGIADLVARADDKTITRLCENLSAIEALPQTALLQQLGQHALPTAAVEAICKLAHSNRDNPALVSACLRACAQSAAVKLCLPLIKKLAAQTPHLETTLTVITHYFGQLDAAAEQVKWLDLLAQQADNDGFARVITNLAMQPAQQGIVMKMLASDYLTPALANALSRLIQQQRQAKHEPH